MRATTYTRYSPDFELYARTSAPARGPGCSADGARRLPRGDGSCARAPAETHLDSRLSDLTTISVMIAHAAPPVGCQLQDIRRFHPLGQASSRGVSRLADDRSDQTLPASRPRTRYCAGRWIRAEVTPEWPPTTHSTGQRRPVGKVG